MMDLGREAIGEMSSYELVSIYINRSYGDKLEALPLLEAELRKRRLPVPEPMPLPPPEPAAGKSSAMSRETFLSYLLLIYTLTGLFYSWLYLPMRLIRGDFDKDRKHRLVQTAIALLYQAAEIATYTILTGE